MPACRFESLGTLSTALQSRLAPSKYSHFLKSQGLAAGVQATQQLLGAQQGLAGTPQEPLLGLAATHQDLVTQRLAHEEALQVLQQQAALQSQLSGFDALLAAGECLCKPLLCMLVGFRACVGAACFAAGLSNANGAHGSTMDWKLSSIAAECIARE